MRKNLFILFLVVAVLSWSVRAWGASPPASPPNDEVIFQVLHAGTPDQYGNQILNSSIAQDVGGVWASRGVVTSANYTAYTDLYGVINESTLFSCVVRLNYTWAGSSSQATGRTAVYLTVADDLITEPMTVYKVDLVSQSQGWVVEYRYVWDAEGKPDLGSQQVTYRYAATGSSQNYNLTYYDASFTTDNSHYVNDCSNTTDFSDYTYRCSLSSDGDILTFTQNDPTVGFGAEDNGIGKAVSAVYPFIELSVIDATCDFDLWVEDSGTDVFTFSISSAGIYRYNLRALFGGDALSKLRIRSTTATTGQYVKMDYVKLYGIENWQSSSMSNRNQIAYNDGEGLNITTVSSDSTFSMVDYSADTAFSSGSIVVKFKTDSDTYFRLIVYDGTDYYTSNAYQYTDYTEIRINFDELTDIDTPINHVYLNSYNNDGSDGWIKVKWLYFEEYGSFNVSLDNNGADFGASENTIYTSYQGYGAFTDSDDHLTVSGFQPLNGLGAVTVLLWGAFAELGSDYVYFGQYVDASNLIEIGMDGVDTYNGNITFTIGNSTDAVSVEAPIVAITLNDLRSFFFMCFTWEKGGALNLRVNGTTYASTSTLTGAISAASDLYIGPRGGSGDSPMWIYDVAMYYRVLTSTEINNIYALGPETGMPYLYHQYSCNEYLIGSGASPAVVEDGVFTSAIREIWYLDYNGNTISGYLSPNPLLYPDVYIWLFGWVMMALGPCGAVYKSRNSDDKSNTLLYIGIGLIVLFIGASIVVAGV